MDWNIEPMTEEFQPGDRTPRDHQHPGDASKLNALAHDRGPDTRAGDSAPTDRASASDHARNRNAEEASEPIGNVHFSAPFIRRPVATFLLSIAIILAGAVAYKLLPVASLPEVEFPVISVGAGLPGADPETMASSVATPLERQFSRIAGINQMTSTSQQGSVSITMQFDLTRDINGAARDVQAAISAAQAQLPANLPSNPTYRKINPADAPILILALTSDSLTVPQIYDAADSILAQKLASVAGVGQTFVGGSSKPAVRIEANPSQLTSYNLSLNAVQAAAQTFNVNQPKGYLNGDTSRWSVSTSDQLFGADAYRPLVIATSRGPVSNAQASNGLQSNVSSATTGTSGTTAAATATGSSGGAAVSTTGTASTTSSTTTTSAGSTPPRRRPPPLPPQTSTRAPATSPPPSTPTAPTSTPPAPTPPASSALATSPPSSIPSKTSTPSACSTASRPSSSSSSNRPAPTSSTRSTTS